MCLFIPECTRCTLLRKRIASCSAGRIYGCSVLVRLIAGRYSTNRTEGRGTLSGGGCAPVALSETFAILRGRKKKVDLKHGPGNDVSFLSIGHHATPLRSPSPRCRRLLVSLLNSREKNRQFYQLRRSIFLSGSANLNQLILFRRYTEWFLRAESVARFHSIHSTGCRTNRAYLSSIYLFEYMVVQVSNLNRIIYTYTRYYIYIYFRW